MKSSSRNRKNYVIVQDHFTDNDDLEALAALLKDHRDGTVRCLNIAVDKAPAKKRAQGAAALVKRIDPGIQVSYNHAHGSGPFMPYEFDFSFPVKEVDFPDATASVITTLKGLHKRSETATYLVTAQFSILAATLKAQPALFQATIEKVVMMAGVAVTDGKVILKDGQIQPDDSNNILFDPAAASYVYHSLQQLGIPMVILSRHTANQIKLTDAFFAPLSKLNEVGQFLHNTHEAGLNNLWRRCWLDKDDPNRFGLAERCTPKWFITVFLKGTDPKVGPDDPVYHLIPGGIAGKPYDLLTYIASHEVELHQFFAPMVVPVKGVDHLIIGLTPQDHGIIDIPALQAHVEQRLTEGVKIFS